MKRILGQTGAISGKVVVVILLLAVLIMGAYAVWRISRSTEETPPAMEPGAELTDTIPPGPLGLGMPAYHMTQADLDTLRAMGLEDPINDLLNDLKDHPELIPEEGTLGGTMRFVPSESRIVSPERVIGYYEDGHIAGRLLLEYEVVDGEITWTVIEQLPAR
ncbi:hypothetical protein GF420_06075 [candidate division GN15 bacterium]|nr:hypothetical protein [candidate division GN15 bacterium]